MPDNRTHILGIVVKRAIKQPVSHVIMLAGLLSSVGMGNAWPIVGSFTVLIGYILIKLRNENFIRAAIREEQVSHIRDDRMNRTFRIEELDVESRVKMKSIVRLQAEIAEDVTNSPVDEVAAGLTDTVTQTDKIVQRALEMAQRRRELILYLNKTEPDEIESRIQSIQTKIASESNPMRISDLETSLAAKKHELEDYQAIQQASARVLDELDSIECSFASLRAKLVRIKSTDLADWVAANDDLVTEIGGLNRAVDTLEQSIEEVLSMRSGG